MTRRGTVALIGQGTTASGDSELTGAIIRGMTAARVRPPEPEQVEVVAAEIDRQRINQHLLRVAVANHKTAEDYELLTAKARADYEDYLRVPAPIRMMGRALLAIYGLAVYILSMAYRCQDGILGRRAA